ncbi:FBL15 [Acrasis kona]|uniref:FBL15 n=1 Tax=Acrasis kona TaxID=1008807 RepID=A0AAW2YH99_9EUKA
MTKRLKTGVNDCFTNDLESYDPFKANDTLIEEDHVFVDIDVPELLYIIFTYMHTPETITVLGLVCKSWYHAIHNYKPSVLSHLYIDSNIIHTPHHHTHFIKRTSFISKRPSLYENKYFKINRVKDYIKYPEEITHLDLSGISIDGFDTLFNSFIEANRFNKLQQLTMSNIPSFTNFEDNVHLMCQELTKIKLISLPNLHQRGVKLILANANRLCDLQIVNCQLNHSQQLPLTPDTTQFNTFKTLPSLEKLHLEGCVASILRSGYNVTSFEPHEFLNLIKMKLIKFIVTRSPKSSLETFFVPKLKELDMVDVQFHQGVIVTDDVNYKCVSNSKVFSEEPLKPVLIQSSSLERLNLDFRGSVASPSSDSAITKVNILISCVNLTSLSFSNIDKKFNVSGLEQCVNLCELSVVDWTLQLHHNNNKKSFNTQAKKYIFKHLRSLTLINFSTSTNHMPEWDCPKLKKLCISNNSLGGLHQIKINYPLLEHLSVQVSAGPSDIDASHLDNLKHCDVQCNNLKDLRLSKCNEWLTNDTLDNIISSSATLSTLILNDSSSIRYLNIKKFNCSKLSTFAVRNCDNLSSVIIPSQSLAQFYAVQCPKLQLINIGTRKEDIGFFRISNISKMCRVNHITI